MPFFGGSDDRACLEFIIQLAARNRGISAHIDRLEQSAEMLSEQKSSGVESHPSEPVPTAAGIFGIQENNSLTVETPIPSANQTIGGATDTVYPVGNRQASSTSDSISYDLATAQINSLHLPIHLSTTSTFTPLALAIEKGRSLEEDTMKLRKRFIAVLGRGRRDAVSHRREFEAMQIGVSISVRKAMGEVATVFYNKGIGRNLLIIQSGLGRTSVEAGIERVV